MTMKKEFYALKLKKARKTETDRLFIIVTKGNPTATLEPAVATRPGVKL